jgi:hypothetical protein
MGGGHDDVRTGGRGLRIAMLAPGTRDAVGREDALRFLAELGDV